MARGDDIIGEHPLDVPALPGSPPQRTRQHAARSGAISMTQRATREIADFAQTLKRAASLSGETAPGWSGLITMVVVGERSVMRESLVCFIDSRTTEFSILSLDDADALDELD